MKRPITLLLILWLYGTSALAITPQDLPEPLRPWINWVLADEDQYQCPFFFEDFQDKHCSWPGTLNLRLQAAGGTFDMGWTLYRQDWIFLPGDSEHWPQQVSIANQAVAVIAKDDKPAIQLPAGHYRISGRFFWDNPPESLAIPDSVGLIRLAIDGKDIAYPEIKQGAVWLNADADKQAGDGGNRLDIQVFREIIDDVPLQVVTRLELEVSGVAREVSLPHAILPDFIPVALNSPLPARLEANGRLLVQVRPGRWSIQIHARHPAPLAQLDFTVADPEWPQSEVWVFQAMPALRLVEIEKPVSIDASQTNLPGEWRHLPAYQVKQGDSMVFKVIRRGDPEPEPNQLRLNRKLWLDFDGGGYTVNDRIAGTMTLDWRLNALPDTQLGQVLLNGQNQLITQLVDGWQGVEVRRGAIDLNADSRITGPIDELSVTGWQQRFNRVEADLNVPPGWRLLAVSGVDNVPDSWLTHWTLLDLFLVLIAALAVGRLWSWRWGLFALISLVLIWHEADAPRLIWLHILAALALIRVLPANRFLRWVTWYRNACWLVLLAIVVPFMIAQIRIGLYPQLEKPWQAITGPTYPASADAGGAQMMEMAPAAPQAMAEKNEERMFKKSRAYSAAPASLAKPAVNFDRIDPDANLQTGPGLPQWQWQQLHLSWNGAVDSGQQIRLWYLPPAVTMLLHFVQALLAAVLALRMLGLVPNAAWTLPLPTLACVMALLLLSLPAQKVYADFPEQQMLEQLKNRLLEAPQCLPACAEIAAMNLSVKPAEMLIELEIHAQQDVAAPLPAKPEQWMPERVEVDGKDAAALIRGDDDVLWLALGQGVHKVLLFGRHASHDRFSLPLPLPPQHTILKTDGWRVEGLYEDGRVGPQLEFSRLETDNAAVLKQSSLPAFVRVERTLHLGLDWRVTTRVVRLAGGDSPILLELPLLAGEAVTSPEIRVKDGKVLVNMAAGQSELEWQSQLKKAESLELKAAETSQWSELWRADVSPIWHIQTSGIAMVHHQNAQGVWMPEWRPWPGETVRLDVSRPQAVVGATLTIDKSELRIHPGKRSEDAELKLDIRSSKGGLHSVVLPEQAVLQSVLIDGVSQPIRQKGGTVTLPIRPGAQQVVLNWQSPFALHTLLTTPRVNLGADSVNSHLQVITGEDRWVLCTWGPKFGPAALIWGLLIVLALLAAGLGRIRATPLRHWQWFLLLVGLSQIHIGAALVVVGWLLAQGWRERHVLETRRCFNLVQIGLALLTLASLVLLFAAVRQGLLGAPDMQISGNQSTAYDLNWYQDRSHSELPVATVISLPLMAYRLLMLAWSLWMATALLDWLRWGWSCFAHEGIWKSKPIKTPA